MRIVTVNVPESYIEAMKRLVDNNNSTGLFPSRSELIRVAVRKFLIKELKMAKKLAELSSLPELKDKDDENLVRVPINKINEKNEPVREFKTFKIIERLE